MTLMSFYAPATDRVAAKSVVTRSFGISITQLKVQEISFVVVASTTAGLRSSTTLCAIRRVIFQSQATPCFG